MAGKHEVQHRSVRNLRQYMMISEAAELLGVSAGTLRNWDAAGKLVPVRNPMNRYRLYRRQDLEKILAEMATRAGDAPPKRKQRKRYGQGQEAR